MTLEEYRAKRNFENTTEPGGNMGGNKKIFVIQKHDAEHLHYDLRLGIGGVLVSWVVPKGLSTAANEKRLGIRTEDHPMDYADFEGVIPEGNYGAGTVMVWDQGTYEVISDKDNPDNSLQHGLKKGAFKVALKGKKIRGGYAFVRMDPQAGEEHWLIFKRDDSYADARRNPVSSQPNSVLSGRSMEEIKKEASK